MDRSDSPPLLEAIGLSRCAHDGSRLLQDVSLAVDPGDRLAITGRSGSGKTLLMRAMTALDPLSGGEVRWRGQSVQGAQAPRFRSRVVYLPQRAALLDGNVEQNLQRPLSLAVHRERRFDRHAAVAALENLGRDESFLAKRRDGLSGGEMQIVALLRALQLQPEVLLLDEPTAALDAESAAAAEALALQWLAQSPQQRALVWTSHDAEQTARVATRQFVIAEGRLVD